MLKVLRFRLAVKVSEGTEGSEVSVSDRLTFLLISPGIKGSKVRASASYLKSVAPWRRGRP